MYESVGLRLIQEFIETVIFWGRRRRRHRELSMAINMVGRLRGDLRDLDKDPISRDERRRLLATELRLLLEFIGSKRLLKGFVSARTRRKFSAYLVRDPASGKVGFEFEARAPKAPKAAAAKEPAADPAKAKAAPKTAKAPAAKKAAVKKNPAAKKAAK